MKKRMVLDFSIWSLGRVPDALIPMCYSVQITNKFNPINHPGRYYKYISDVSFIKTLLWYAAPISSLFQYSSYTASTLLSPSCCSTCLSVELSSSHSTPSASGCTASHTTSTSSVVSSRSRHSHPSTISLISPTYTLFLSSLASYSVSPDLHSGSLQATPPCLCTISSTPAATLSPTSISNSTLLFSRTIFGAYLLSISIGHSRKLRFP